ncbi:hypothetical protein B296_00043641 [Ensete ventricosum]|uniref:Uncharacterized protein n=1 Tax=Ensete ventricosum TaxID=4639 RepID=A0A426X1S3_ENSVE|nr:hypothetical protein B296_00043641 [Ensete ventricosum]
MVRAIYSPPGQFTHRKVLPVTRILCLNKIKLLHNPVTSGNLAASLPVFFPIISLCVPSELPDSFGESLSELSVRSHCIVRTWLDA